MSRLEPTGTLLGTLAALGDIGVVGSARLRASSEGWDAPFASLRPLLADADAAFANLEFPIGERAWVREGRSEEFFHDADVAGALVRAGVSVVSLANNHMMDCGPQGLTRTLEVCRAAGLATVGAGEDLATARTPWRATLNGRRWVMLAYGTTQGDAASVTSPGIAPLEAALVAADIARWRPEADVLVVSAHWGSMYVDYPPPRVLEAAKGIAAAGADIVLGHHPHVLQGAERVGRSLVAYSLGDAVFNCRAGDFHSQVAADKRLESGVFLAQAASDAHGLTLRPTRLDQDGFPGVVSLADAEASIERWNGLSAGLAAGERAFAEGSASTLLQYEVQSLATYVRQGRWGRVLRLLGSVRPRHLPVLWHALSRRAGPR